MRYHMKYLNLKTGESGMYVTDAPDRNGAHTIFRVNFPREQYGLVYVEETKSPKPKTPILTAKYDEFSYRIISGDFCEDDLIAIHDALHPEEEQE
jgi:hypothetical protein